MRYILHAGTCEQYQYTLNVSSLSEALSDVRRILNIPPDITIRKTITPPGYPKGARHYKVRSKKLGKHYSRDFLLIIWEK